MNSKIKKLISVLTAFLLSFTAFLPNTVMNLAAADGAIRDIGPNFSNFEMIDSLKLYKPDANGQPDLTKPIPPNSIKKDDEIIQYFEWSISDQEKLEIQAGHYHDFYLPEEFVMPANIPDSARVLADEDGQYAHWNYEQVVHPDTGKTVWRIRVTFDEAIANKSDVHGNIWFAAKVNQDVITNPGEHEIRNPYGDPIEITVDPDDEQSGVQIEKSGTLKKQGAAHTGNNPDQIDWTVLINKGYRTLQNPSVVDAWPTGLTYKEVVSIREAIVDFEGNVTGYGPTLVAGTDYDVATDGTVTFKGTYATINKPYEILYRTDINEPTISENSRTFVNKATLKSTNEADVEATSSALIARWDRLLTKAAGTPNSTTGLVNWTIAYNNRGNVIEAGSPYLKLVDTWSKKPGTNAEMKVLNGVPGIKVYLKGTTTEYTGAYTVVITTDPVTGEQTGLEVQFAGPVSEALDVKYTTEVQGFLDEYNGYNNIAKVDDYETPGVGVDFGQTMMNKSTPAINFNTKKIDWRLLVNQPRNKMENWSITDTYSSRGLTMDQSTFVMRTIATPAVTLVRDVDYTLEITTDADGETGFKVTFPVGSPYATTSEAFDINFKTDYEMNKVIAGGTRVDGSAINYRPGSDVIFHNIGQLEGTLVDETDPANPIRKNVDIKSDAIRRTRNEVAINGQKSGSYDRQTKQVTWTVNVNYNSEILKDAVLRDTIQGVNPTQKFLPESVVVQEFTVNSGGTIVPGAVVYENQAAVGGFTGTVTMPTTANGNELTVTFPDTETGTTPKKYRVVFKTLVEDEIIGVTTFNNIGRFTNTGFPERELPATIQVTEGNKFIGKSGKQDGMYANWTVVINESQSTIPNAILEDTPSNNQLLLEDSFKLYAVTNLPPFTTANPVAKGAELKAKTAATVGDDWDYEIVIADPVDENSPQTFQLIFRETLRRPYVLEYSSLILAGNNEAVTNKAVLSGSNGTHGEDSEEGRFTFSVGAAGGGASGKVGNLTIVKQDGETLTPLANVTLELYVSNTSATNPSFRRLFTQTTDATGTINYGKLPYTTYSATGDLQYFLKEVGRPDGGYIISDALVKGEYEVVVNDENADPNIINANVPNVKAKLKLNKVNVHGILVPGATFRLEFRAEGSNEFVTLTNDLTALTTTGEITLDGVAAGTYRLTEITANPEYVRNTQPLEFTLAKDGNGELLPIQESDLINYKGSVRLIKQDTDGARLEGVVFDLYTAAGTRIGENLTTDANGIIEVGELAPGSYYFREVSSVGGNIANETPINFVIASEAAGQPTTQEITVLNGKGSVELTKEDEAGNKLEGAEFTLYVEGNPTPLGVGSSNANGVVRYDGLAPGNYYFLETKAPTGYIINGQPVNFVIPEKAQEDNVVIRIADAFVNYKGGVVLRKVDETGKVLPGVVYGLHNADGSVVAEYTTNNAGIIKIDELAPGSYYFVEKSTVEGNIVDTRRIDFTVAADANGEPEGVVIEAINTKGAVQFTKVSEDAAVRPGAEFSIFKDGNKYGNSVTSDVNGVVYIDGLEPGNYVIRETKPAPGYVLNTSEINVLIPETTDQDKFVLSGENFINYQGRVELTKVDEEAKLLAGVVYDLYNVADEVIGTYTTDENGVIAVDGLAPGNYYFVEKSTVEGNVVNNTPIEFTIVAEAAGQPETIKVDALNAKAAVEFVKVDAAGNTLAGAEFALYTEDGEAPILTVVADEAGKVSVDGLAPGNYYFAEIKAAAGFILNTDLLEFEVPAVATAEKVVLDLGEFVNYQGGLIVEKVDENGRRIKEAEFTLTDASGTVITVTTKDGLGRFEKLAPGTYKLKETKAPAGYVLDTKEHEVVIPEFFAGEYIVATIKVENKKSDEELPTTGSNNMTEMISIAMIGLGVVALYVSKKYKENQI